MAGTQNALLSLVNLSQVVIKGTVGEKEINQLKNGQEVQAKVPAIPGKTFTGKISNIALAADSQTMAYPIKVQLATPGYIMKPVQLLENITSQQKLCASSMYVRMIPWSAR